MDEWESLLSFLHMQVPNRQPLPGKEAYFLMKNCIPADDPTLLAAWTFVFPNGLSMLKMSSVFLEQQPSPNMDNKHYVKQHSWQSETQHHLY